MTPYDAALRWRKSELDLLRRQKAGLENQHDILQAEIHLLEKQFAAEELVAKHQPLLNFAQFATLNRQERLRLQQDADRLQADIAEIAERIAEAFQDFKALDIAARNYLATEKRKAASRLQLEMDDIAARKVIAFGR